MVIVIARFRCIVAVLLAFVFAAGKELFSFVVAIASDNVFACGRVSFVFFFVFVVVVPMMPSSSHWPPSSLTPAALAALSPRSTNASPAEPICIPCRINIPFESRTLPFGAP